MFFKFIRRFHTNSILWAVDSSNLAKLRKETGYTFINCKKALEMHSNDLEKAKQWLHKQAQELGWTKATKLAGRTTSQGLIALKYDNQHAALVELNCETDFVARNDKFNAMAEEAANACFHLTQSSVQANSPITKMCLDSERLGNLKADKEKTLSEKLALMIGSVGENASLRRAECWKTSKDLHLSCYAHPSTSVHSFMTGKYAGILAYKCDNITENTVNVARQICQHIVGMNPSKIGDENFDKPSEDADDETCLIYQEFVANPTLLVKDVLQEHHITVLDYIRYECGGNVDQTIEQSGESLENVQTCQ